MKNNNILTLFVLLFGLFTLALRGADPAPVPHLDNPITQAAKDATSAGKPALDALTKERDDLRSALAQAQGQAQQTAIVTEYYKAMAEKNQAILQLITAQQQLTEANARVTTLQAELDALKKSVIQKPEAKK